MLKLIGFHKRTWWIHLPVGLLVGWFCYENPTAAALIATMFLVYEVREAMAIGDKCYEDIKGAIFGLAIMAGILSVF